MRQGKDAEIETHAPSSTQPMFSSVAAIGDAYHTYAFLYVPVHTTPLQSS